jgi:hypothetical protein
MQPQVLMRYALDCGRACAANATGLSYETISRVLPGQEHEGVKANIRDTMIHHKVALWKLQQPSKIVTDDEIIAGKCQPFKTCVLVHSINAPTLTQHWVNFAGVRFDGRIILWWNDPEDKERYVTPKEFKSMYRTGSLNHAHEVGVGKVREPSWWERFIYWFTVKI